MEAENKSKIGILGTNLVYLIAMILLVVVGSVVQKWNFNYGILITEFILVALPVILYVTFKRGNIKQELRLNKLEFVDGLLVVLIFLSGYFVAVFINLIGLIITSLFGKLMALPIPTAHNFPQYLLLVAIVAGSAGICEELLFRGLVMRGYQKLGMWPGILFTALLFGALHLNIQNFLGPVFLGVLLGFVVYRTNSIFAGMLGHFTNNAISVTLGYVLMSLPFYDKISTNAMQKGAVTTLSLIASTLVYGFIACLTGGIMLTCMKTLSDRSKVPIPREQPELRVGEALKNIRLSWPLYIAALIFAAMLVMQIIYIGK